MIEAYFMRAMNLKHGFSLSDFKYFHKAFEKDTDEYNVLCYQELVYKR